MKLKTLLHAVIISIVFLIPFNVFAETNTDDQQGLFVFVTSPDPQTQMMAMVLSTQVLTQGKSVQILLCSSGGDLALKNGEEVILKPKNKSPQALLKGLMGKGVKVQVCPLYLPNKDATADALIEGVTQADPAVIAETLMQPALKLFTF